jgi:hypothetical protein
MKQTLQDQYLLIKEGKGHKGVFLADAKRQFPNIVRNAATFEEASSCLKTKNIISENVIGLNAINSIFEPKKKESYELAFENFLAEAKKKKEEDEKAELKATSKQVEKDLEHNFDRKDDKNPDNLIFDQIMTGYYTEMKDPKNADKTMQELKDMVFKNLQKDPIFYTKEGQFGVKGLGYSVEHPGLGEPKEPKGKYKASGYGDLNEGVMYGDSDGDFNEQEDNKERANWYYDAYLGEKDPKKKDEYLKIAREYGSYLGWGEEELPVNEGMDGMDPLEREARIALSMIGYNHSVLSNYSKQDFIDTLKRESKDRFDNEKLANLASKLESLKNESKISPEVYPNNTKINYKGEPVTIIGNFMNRNDESIQYTVEDKDGKTSEISSADKNITKITTESLEESKLRKVIREMINAELEEAYQLVNINPLKSDKEREERDPQQFLTTYIEPSVVDSLTKNQHLRILRNPSNPENVTLAIRATLAPISSKNLGKTTDNLDKLGIDIPTDFKSFLTDTNNLGGEKKLPTRIGEMVTYKVLNNATLNKNGSLVIKVSNPKYNKPMESLQESVEKELAAINKEAEHEIIASKLDKVQALIDKKQTQISRLDEDEDLKDLTDAKKVKEISKDIKSLEKAKAKLEKMMHKGKAKSPRKEVIDETDETIDEAENDLDPKSLKDAEKSIKNIQTIAKDISKTEIFEDDEETAYKIKEKAEQYYNEYGTLEDALREFENEDEKEFARQHLTDAYGL